MSLRQIIHEEMVHSDKINTISSVFNESILQYITSGDEENYKEYIKRQLSGLIGKLLAEELPVAVSEKPEGITEYKMRAIFIEDEAELNNFIRKVILRYFDEVNDLAKEKEDN